MCARRKSERAIWHRERSNKKSQKPPSPGSSPEDIENSESDTQIDKIAQESSNNISKDEWFISIENYGADKRDMPRIRRIPSFLPKKQSNTNSYDPLVVSIGPYHHGTEKLKAFEKLKIPIAKEFCRACGNQVSDLYEEVAKVGKSARECYEEGSIKVDDDEFNRMMFLDACFVLHFMSMFLEHGSNYSNGTDMELNPLLPWSCYLNFVWRDFFSLENQIPLQVLKVLMKFMFKNESEWIKLIQNFIDQKVNVMPPQKNTCTKAFEKLHARMMGRSDQEKNEPKLDLNDRPHLLHLAREQLIGPPPKKMNEKKSGQWYSYRSVTELKSKGIHFRPSQTYHITDVTFKHHLISGTLTLPPITVDDSTKPLLLNLVAYEMCPDGPSDFRIMSYICLMDSLIDHADDVKELRRSRILVNNLGSDDELAKLFNEIANGLVFDPEAYAQVKSHIQNHCESKAKVWMAEWIHDHFSSPWAFLAFLAAIFVIALTMVQAYFAAFPH